MRSLLRSIQPTAFFTCATPLVRTFAVKFKVTLKVVSSPLATMDARAPLTSEPVWQQLQEYFNKHKDEINLQKLFSEDPERFKKYRYVII